MPMYGVYCITEDRKLDFVGFVPCESEEGLAKEFQRMVEEIYAPLFPRCRVFMVKPIGPGWLCVEEAPKKVANG